MSKIKISESDDINWVQIRNSADLPSISPSYSRMISYNDGLYYLNPDIDYTFFFNMLNTIPGTVGARVFNSADLAIPNDDRTTLAFNSEDYDTHAMHSTVANTHRVYAPFEGIYLMLASVQFEAGAGGGRQCRIMQQGGAVLSRLSFGTDTDGATNPCKSFSIIFPMNAGAYVYVDAWQESGGALDVLNADEFSPYFMMHKVG